MNETIKSGLKLCLLWNVLVGISLLFNIDSIIKGHSINGALAGIGIALGFVSAIVLGQLIGER